MEEKKIEIGEIVQLNSGGPEMTVISAYENLIKCGWFTIHNEYKTIDVENKCVKTIEKY